MGSIVVDELVFPVDGIELHDGAFLVKAHAEGPFELQEGHPETRLHDNEGKIVLVARLDQAHIKAEVGDRVNLEFQCRIYHQVGNA